jgi:hypothetical protein
LQAWPFKDFFVALVAKNIMHNQDFGPNFAKKTHFIDLVLVYLRKTILKIARFVATCVTITLLNLNREQPLLLTPEHIL